MSPLAGVQVYPSGQRGGLKILCIALRRFESCRLHQSRINLEEPLEAPQSHPCLLTR